MAAGGAAGGPRHVLRGPAGGGVDPALQGLARGSGPRHELRGPAGGGGGFAALRPEGRRPDWAWAAADTDQGLFLG